MPFVREVEPEAGASGSFDAVAVLQGEQGRIADEQGGVCVREHGGRIGRRWEKLRIVIEEFAEEDLRVGE